jgi:hypothetical protein
LLQLILLQIGEEEGKKLIVTEKLMFFRYLSANLQPTIQTDGQCLLKHLGDTARPIIARDKDAIQRCQVNNGHYFIVLSHSIFGINFYFIAPKFSFYLALS